METKHFNYIDTPIEYNVSGEGLSVVLIHGFGEDETIWDNVVEALAKQYRCIVPKIPGSGNTTLLKDSPGITDYADLIHAILQQENLSKTIMVGHSMGGYISLAFAKKFPHALTALCLFHSSAYEDDEAKKDVRRKAIRMIQEKGSLTFLQTAIPGLFYDTEKHKAAIEILLQKAQSFTPEALVQYYNAMIDREDTTDVLKNISVPVQFILGEHDKAVPFKHGLQQSHLPAQSSLTILRQTAHMGMIEETQKSINSLMEFLGEGCVK